MEMDAMNTHETKIFRLFLRAAIVLVASLGQVGLAANEDRVASVENTRATLEKWVETRKLISQEQRDLALSKQTLNDRIELVQREIESLHEKSAQAKKSIEETDRKRADLSAENEKLKAASESLGETLAMLEKRTGELLKRLPEPLRDRVKPLSHRLPADGRLSALSLSERFQNVIGILNEVNKFNREITMTSEVRSLPDGTSAEVTAMYVGISQGYYVGANGSVAGVGLSTASGWEWKPDNAAAPHILQAIAILKNEQIATFVQLPFEE